MRRVSIVLACAVFASQACLAGPPRGQRFDLGRPNTTTEQFQQDRNDCVATIIAALRRQMHSSRADRLHLCQGNPNGLPPNPGYAASTPYSPAYDRPADSYGYHNGPGPDKYYYADAAFLECMRLKGYTRVPESWAFHTGPLWR
jgi:hypothetical protein